MSKIQYRSWKVEHFLFVAGVLSGAVLGARGPLLETGRAGLQAWWGSSSGDRFPAAEREGAGIDDCSFVTGRHGSLGYQRTRYKTGVCSVYIRNTDKNDHFRSFSFGSNGSLMIFNQFGESGRDNGARLYYFFPRTQELPVAIPRFELGELAVSTAAGALIRFSTTDASVAGTSPELELSIQDDIVQENRGGVEVVRWSGILLDVGFTMREQPYYKRPNGEAVFKDPEGHVCKVLNKDIYDYSNPEEPVFRLADDETAYAFLQRKCPGLNLSSLLPNAEVRVATPETAPTGEEAALPVRSDDTVPLRSDSSSAY